jgi:anaerobic selenocysteine-containing dehydrogenase
VAVRVDDGRAVDIWGNEAHPVTAGRLCGKVDKYLDRTYHADRLTTPLRRVGPKGSGQFEAISWDEAIAAVSEGLQQAIDEHGAESVLQYSYAGTMGYLQGEGMAQRLFHRMGASRLGRTICAEAGVKGVSYTVGGTISQDVVDFAHAKLIWLWGTNTLTSNMHLWPFVQQARKAGAKVVVIDPVRTRTARAADEWVPIRPGTDAALALAIMHVLVAEDLVDHDYIERATVGFDELAERVKEWTPERAESHTGVPADIIRAMARDYGTTQPAAIRINYGLQRNRGGGMAARTIACLPALTGAWKHPGGGVQLSSSGSFALDKRGLERPDLLGERSPRTLNMIRLGDALRGGEDDLRRAHMQPRPIDAPPEDPGPPVQALVVYNCNPAAVAPDQGAVLEGLRREDLFTVVLEHFQTDTADYADIVLPATTQLEHWDVVKPYGHLYLGLNRPAIAPVGESLPNSEIFRRIATAMGYTDDCFAESDEAILEAFIESQTHACTEGITWARLLEEGFCRLALPSPYMPFAEGKFPTPSGRCELRSETMARDGYDPLPNYEPFYGQSEQGADALICISPPAHSFLNSTFVNVGRFAAREKGPMLLLHPEDAQGRGITDGMKVSVENERGVVELEARVTDQVIRGTVVAPSIWWNKLSEGRRNINWLTPPDETDMGGGALFFEVPVRVQPA